jgi:hypothetical protein
LGFSSNDSFYVFTVLPFGLSSVPYIFTKCLTPLVKYWRLLGFNIMLYLDDVFGMTHSYENAVSDSLFVKDSFRKSGFSSEFRKVGFTWNGLGWCGTLFVYLFQRDAFKIPNTI